jgi:ABC-type nitrate/sulfonate/bicarbonate transport system substrate-binding protein
LKGKKIGVFSGTTATSMLRLFFKDKGIDSSTMQFVQLPPPQQLTALSAGSIDALFAYEPTVTIGLTSGMRKIYGSVYAEQVNHNPLGGGLLTARFISEHPAEAKKVVDALDRANDYIRTNDKETRDIAAALFKFSPEVASSVSLSYANHTTQIDKAVVNQLVDLFVSAGELKSKPDLANAYYQP